MKIQIGLGRQWTGLGDLLGFLVVANHCPDKYQIVLADHMKRFQPLFVGYDTIVDDSILPLNTHLNLKSGLTGCHAYKTMLNNLSIKADNYMPRIDIKKLKEMHNCNFLKRNKEKYAKEIILSTNPSKTAEAYRKVPASYFEEYIKQQSDTLFHHFRLDWHYSFSFENVAEYTNIDVASYALACNEIGDFLGVNTGDYHLAVASGIPPEKVKVVMKKDAPRSAIVQWIYPETELILI